MILTREHLPNPKQPTLAPHQSPFKYYLSLIRVRVRDADSGKMIGTYGKTSTAPIPSAEFSPDGGRILRIYFQESELYDLDSGKLLFSFPSRAAFSPDGKHVLAYSSNEVRIWRRRRPEWWWGVFWLPQFWFTVLFAVGFVWSLRRDYKRLMRVQLS